MNFLNKFFGRDSKDSNKSGELQMQNINAKATKERRIRKTNVNLKIKFFDSPL